MNDINYQLKISTRARRPSLNISVKNGLEVIIPPKTPKSFIEAFITKNRTWIKKHQHLIDAAQAPFSPPNFIELLALKKRWAILYIDSNTREKKIQLFSEKILLSKQHQTKENFQRGIRFCLKNIAIQHLSTHMAQLSQKHQLPFDRLTFRLQSTRWGSCSLQKNIALNAALLFMPFQTVHYVMIHELCHTQYLNHSKRFWNKVESLMPNYNQHKKILKQTHLYLPTWI
jgi:predicted metal-dependent hydrolase